MIPRIIPFDEPQENPARKKPAKGISRLFRCWLFDEPQEGKARFASSKSLGNIGGIFTLEPVVPKKKKKKQPRVAAAAAPAAASLVSFLPVPAAATPPVEDPSPAIKRGRRVRELLLLATAGSSPYRR